MFSKYLISDINGKTVIYLYLNNRYEISNDLFIVKNDKLINNNARNYLENMGINYKGKDIYLVVSDIIVAKLNSKLLSKKLNYLEYIRYGKTSINEFLEEEHPSIKFIDLEKSNGIIQNIKLNNYLLNVIINEMPNVLSLEALKAEAVIARSYVVKRLNNNKPIRQFNELQIYKNKEDLKKILVSDYKKYIDLVKKAIIDTNGEIIKYKDDIIECFTHYRNNGKTENSKNILKQSYPYLVSVKSPDIDENNLLRYRKISNKHLSKLLNMDINKTVSVSILEKTDGGNTKYVKFNNKIFDGFTLAKRLALISYDYFIDIKDDYTWFITRGCGINLGLSKYGAKKMADNGYNYKDILIHYFPNTYIDKVN